MKLKNRNGKLKLKNKKLGYINALVSLSDKREEEYIVCALEKQYSIIEREEKYLEKLKELKLGLMEDLLTGKVSVNID